MQNVKLSVSKYIIKVSENCLLVISMVKRFGKIIQILDEIACVYTNTHMQKIWIDPYLCFMVSRYFDRGLVIGLS